uniref:hypothetical protein n=1 Tax=Candidatus Laterigemmans baculatus TaxID=2770505 RepID=UPI00193F259C
CSGITMKFTGATDGVLSAALARRRSPRDFRRSSDPMSLNPRQRDIAIRGLAFSLRFLVHLDGRANARAQMPELSDAAIFHRLVGLTWAFDVPEAVAILTADERLALERFHRLYRALPWLPTKTHDFISEVSNEDLTTLLPSANDLLHLLDKRLVAIETQ